MLSKSVRASGLIASRRLKSKPLPLQSSPCIRGFSFFGFEFPFSINFNFKAETPQARRGKPSEEKISITRTEWEDMIRTIETIKANQRAGAKLEEIGEMLFKESPLLPLGPLGFLKAHLAKKRRESEFLKGDSVHVNPNARKVEELAAGHGDWNPDMKKYCGEKGVVQIVLGHVVRVKFPDGQEWSFNPEALSPVFSKGDSVHVNPNTRKVEELAEGHGGWVSYMKKYCGEKGVVQKVRDHFVRVKFPDGQEWSFNPRALSLHFSAGHHVHVNPDARKVEELAEGHGGWVSYMKKYCGEKGLVQKVHDHFVMVKFPDDQEYAFNPEALSPVFAKGDSVHVNPDARKVEELAEGHGGWNPDMKKYCGEKGVVQKVRDRFVMVKFPDDEEYAFNPEALSPVFSKGDSVHVNPNARKVEELAEGHGEWNPDMKKYCGEKGVVQEVLGHAVSVKFPDGREWLFNPQALTLLKV